MISRFVPIAWLVLSVSLFSGAANATTFQLLQVEPDYSEATLVEPAAARESQPGYRRTALIVISFMASVDITEVEIDCAGSRLRVISEKLHRIDGKLTADKTRVNNLNWISFPASSTVGSLRDVVCKWPSSRDADLEFNGADFWSAARNVYSRTKVPPGLFDDD